MDCGNEPPIPEREPDLLLAEPIPNLHILEVEAVLDTSTEGKPENIRIINKSSKLVKDKIIIKSIESVKFITQGGKVRCHAHLKKNIQHKFKFKIE
jgi:hypothetical protein